jgi:putative ATP-binding cassette transporter
MNLMTFLLRSSARTVIASIAAGAVAGLASVWLIGIIQAEISRPSPSAGRLAWIFGGLAIVAAAARFAAQAAMIRLGQESVAALSLHLIRKTLRLPLRRFERLSVDSLMSVLTQDIVLIAGALPGIPQMCVNVPIVIACLAFMGWLSPLILICGVGFAAPAIAAYVAISGAAGRRLREARSEQDALLGLYRGLCGGFRELKLHAGRRRSYLSGAIEPTTRAVRDKTTRALSLFAAAEGWSQFALFGFLGLVLFVAPGFSAIDHGTLAATVLVVLYLMAPLDVIISWFPAFGRAHASLRRIQALIPELETSEPAACDQGPPAGRLGMGGRVELAGACFTYGEGGEESSFVLGPIDLALQPGELVILAGGNGSGKTTLVKLLCGLYWPTEGLVQVDGRIVREGELEAYRQLFSVVFADGHLFGELHGLDREAEEAVREGLVRMQLEGRVSVRDGRFSTLDLSQGQKRRLALLAALAEDRPVCILDEWAAHQDPAFKEFFYRELLPSLRAAGKAMLIVSHDEDYFGVADRVLRLREGLIVQDAGPRVNGSRTRTAREGVSR